MRNSKAALLGLMLALSANAFADDELRLIATGPDTRTWMNEAQMAELSQKSHRAGHCGGFMDVTDFQEKLVFSATPLWLGEELKPRLPATVNALLPMLSSQLLTQNVEKLSTFRNRYYQSETGVAAAAWIKNQFETLGRGRSDVSVTTVTHNNFRQPSVIATLHGSGPNADEIIVLGAHLDSINWGFGFPNPTASAPGADDDASGISTVLETFRVLTQSGYRPSRTIEFMGYAGEERGLLGSQDIAQKYLREGKKVVAVMQLDMTMYAGSNPALTFITDHVQPELTRFSQTLLDTYVKVPWKEAECGYACSDHASWTEAGYASVFPFESELGSDNPNIHTDQDVLSFLDSAFGLHFAKLATAFAVELAHEVKP